MSYLLLTRLYMVKTVKGCLQIDITSTLSSPALRYCRGMARARWMQFQGDSACFNQCDQSLPDITVTYHVVLYKTG